MPNTKPVQRMAEFARNGPAERDIEQAITALKKGAQLLKYGRRGKPKFCPFRLSNDETSLIWYSGSEEKVLKLNSVTRIVPGQRTQIFQRHPRPEKEYQSFSLIYQNDERSLDLICKDKDEAEVWFVGLKALVAGAQSRKKVDSRSDGVLAFGSQSPVNRTRKNSPLGSPFGSTDSLHQDSGEPLKSISPFESPPRGVVGTEKGFSTSTILPADAKAFLDAASAGGSLHSTGSDVGSDSVSHQIRGVSMEAFRMSMSSQVSSSSQGSGQDENDALGDVFMWGEGIGDGFLGGGLHKTVSGGANGVKMDAVVPKPLDSAVVLDVQNIACGGRHSALVSKQGEVFCWGEESGGRLGHGVDRDVSQPQLVEALSSTNVEFVACGEYHTCAVTMSGELFTWGDGTHNFGLLGHGNAACHWVPKKVNGPIESIRVASIACGPWHTALVTSAGQLFTFGDGTFGVLGHGDTESAWSPREVESLKGLKTVRAACGVWHSAAVVEVMVSTTGSSCASGKLFTWGDGDKGRLGHGDKEQRLVPTCVAAVVEHNFRQVACGASLTVALTTLGQVFTMGGTAYGQLGDPQADGKLPGLVGGKLWESFVEEVACGSHHVAVLTQRTEVFTWGKGANGRLGHGDLEDKNVPTLVEALKDKQVKTIACGSSFTAVICLHKWVSSADQSVCTGCKQSFGFTKKRHNCYNCGLGYCHACSAKKAHKASLAPNPNRPYRVCDACYSKLKKIAEAGLQSLAANKKIGVIRRPDGKDKPDKIDPKVPKPQVPSPKPPGAEYLKQLEAKSVLKRSKKPETSRRVSPVPVGLPHWASVMPPTSFNPGYVPPPPPLPVLPSVPSSRISSRSHSPLSRKPSPPRSTTPTPTGAGLTTPKTVMDELRRTNDLLTEEVTKLKKQIEFLSSKCESQEVDLQRANQKVQEAMGLAGEEAAKSRAAKEVIKSLTIQLKDMADRLPVVGHQQGRQLVSANRYDLPNGMHLPAALDALVAGDHDGPTYGNPRKYMPAATASRDVDINGVSSPRSLGEGAIVVQSRSVFTRTRSAELDSNGSDVGSRMDEARHSSAGASDNGHDQGAEWVEQVEPGVYITLTALPGGGKDLKRVRFSRKRFSERQAEQWWQDNRLRVHEQYNVRGGVERQMAGALSSRSGDDERHSSLPSLAAS